MKRSFLQRKSKTIAVVSILALVIVVLLEVIPGRRLLSQSGGGPRVNVFRPEQTELGVVLPAGDHNVFAASGNGAFPVVSDATFFTDNQSPDYATETWAYEYVGGEPPFTGKYYVNPAIIRREPRYDSLNKLMQVQRGKWYYATSNGDVGFKAGVGLVPAYKPLCLHVEGPTEGAPGQGVQITMKMRNDGMIAWAPGRPKLLLRAVAGQQWLPGQDGDFVGEIPLSQTVNAGADVDFQFSILLPTVIPANGLVTLTGELAAPTSATDAYRGFQLYGHACEWSIRITSTSVCGNGTVESPQERCDDGKTDALDGCDGQCQVEPGWTCEGTNPNVCRPQIPGLGEVGGGTSSTGGGQNTGNLYVTKSITPPRQHHLLGGELGPEILRAEFRADEREDIDVTSIVLGTTSIDSATNGRSVSSFDLYKAGAATPFASATRAGCASGMGEFFCANMQSQQLVVPKNNVVTVLVRPRMKSDTEAGTNFSGDQFEVYLESTGLLARGRTTGAALTANNGNTIPEGEIFYGIASPAPDKWNGFIASSMNTAVLAKIGSITNANPDADNSNVPTGQARIGQFKFTAVPNVNAMNGLNKVVLRGISFAVSSTNVEFDADNWKIYNLADATAVKYCTAYRGGEILSQPFSGNFRIACDGLVNENGVNTTIFPGESITLAINVSVRNPNISASPSTLQVSLEDFNSPLTIQWEDKDDAARPASLFWWVDYPENVVRSTLYSG